MFWWLAQHIVTATILASIVALLCRWGRLGPALRHGLWLLVLIKLLMPPFIYWPWALPFVGSSVAEETANVAVEFSDTDRAAGELFQLFLKTEWREADDGTASAPPERAWYAQILQANPWQAPAWLSPVIVSIWLAGSLAMAVLQSVRMVKFRRLLRDGKTPPRRLVRQVGALATMLSVRPPGTRVLPGIGSPFVWGLHRAQLLWPAALLGRLADGSWRCVIAHELAHLRRRDHWVAFVQMLAECIWWWNPVFWYVRRQLRLNAELACDAWVVSALPEERRAYAEALIEVTEHFSQTALAPALGISGGARQAFERRLTMIMRDRVPCKVPVLGMLVLGLLGLAALPGWSQVQTLKVQASPKPQAARVGELVLDEIDAIVELQANLTDDDEQQEGQAAKSGAGSDRERKLRQMELKIQALRKELDALRAGREEPVRARILRETPKTEGAAGEKFQIKVVPGSPAVELYNKVDASDPKRFVIEATPAHPAVGPKDKDPGHKWDYIIEATPGKPVTGLKEKVQLHQGDIIIDATPGKPVTGLEGKLHLHEGKNIIIEAVPGKPGAVLQDKVQWQEAVPGKAFINLRAKVQPPEEKGVKVQTVPGKAVIGLHNKIETPGEKSYRIEVAPTVRNWEFKSKEEGAKPGERYYTWKSKEGEHAVTLSRVAYKLPPGKAEALSNFLSDNVKAPVLETKVDGDSLVVTTTPEVQHTISAFVALLHSKDGAPKDKRIHKKEAPKEDGAEKSDVLFWLELNDRNATKKAEDVLYFYEKLEKLQKDEIRR